MYFKMLCMFYYKIYVCFIDVYATHKNDNFTCVIIFNNVTIIAE